MLRRLSFLSLLFLLVTSSPARSDDDIVRDHIAKLTGMPDLKMPYFDGPSFLSQISVFASYCDFMFFARFKGDINAFGKAVRENEIKWVVGGENPHPDLPVHVLEGMESFRTSDKSKMRWQLSQVNDPQNGPVFVARFAPPENGGSDKFRIRVRGFPIAANRDFIEKEIDEPDSELESDEVELNILVPDSAYRVLDPQGQHWITFGRRLAHNAGDGRGRNIIDLNLQQNSGDKNALQPRPDFSVEDIESATFTAIPPKLKKYSYIPIFLPNISYLRDQVMGHLRPITLNGATAALTTSTIKGAIWFGTFVAFGGLEVKTAAYAAAVRFLTHLILDVQFEAYNEAARHARIWWGPEEARAFWGQVFFRFITFLPTTIAVKLIIDSDPSHHVVAATVTLATLIESLKWIKVGLVSFNDKISSAIISFVPNVSQKFHLNEGHVLGVVKKSWLQNEAPIWTRGVAEALGMATKSGLPVQYLMLLIFYKKNKRFIEKMKTERPDLATELEEEFAKLEKNFVVRRLIKPIFRAGNAVKVGISHVTAPCGKALRAVANSLF